MYLKSNALLLAVIENLRKLCFIIYELDLCKISFSSRNSMTSSFKNVINGPKKQRRRICHFINRCAKANNKYVKYYDKNKESSYLKYHSINSFYGWAILQKLPVNGFKWVEGFTEFNQGFTKSYNKKSKEGYFLEVDIQYPENLHNVQNHFSFLSERMKTEKFEKLVAYLDDKNEYVIQIRNLKQALSHGSVLKNYIGSLNLIKRHD